jgi:hypothetical protein
MCYILDESNGLNRNRTRNVLTQTSSHNQLRNHDLAYTLITKSLVVLERHTPSWAMMGPCFLFLGYYSVHPRKRRVVLSQLPHVMWASGCWHYERTLYSRRPLKGTGVSIYLSDLEEWAQNNFNTCSMDMRLLWSPTNNDIVGVYLS